MYPESIRDLVKQVSNKHPSDIAKATEEATEAVRQLEDYDDFVDGLVSSAIQALIYQIRHHHNVALKREAGQYGQPAKVLSGNSEGVERAATSAYLSYRIGATVLGDVLGADLAGLAQNEESQAAGHHFNSRLCSRLAEVVPADKRVRDVVSEKKLKGIFEAVKRKLSEAA